MIVHRTLKKLLAAGLIGLAIFWVAKDTEIYLSVAGLSSNNTVYDYHTASLAAQMYFHAHKCDNGVCLPEKDWHCGYDINTDSREFSDCISTELVRAPAWEKLGVLLKRCGKRFEQLTGEPRNAARCNALLQ